MELMRKGVRLSLAFIKLAAIGPAFLIGKFFKDGWIRFPLMMTPGTSKYHFWSGN